MGTERLSPANLKIIAEAVLIHARTFGEHVNGEFGDIRSQLPPAIQSVNALIQSLIKLRCFASDTPEGRIPARIHNAVENTGICKGCILEKICPIQDIDFKDWGKADRILKARRKEHKNERKWQGLDAQATLRDHEDDEIHLIDSIPITPHGYSPEEWEIVKQYNRRHRERQPIHIVGSAPTEESEDKRHGLPDRIVAQMEREEIERLRKEMSGAIPDEKIVGQDEIDETGVTDEEVAIIPSSRPQPTPVDPFDDNDWQQDPRPRFLKEKKHGGTVDHETIPDGFAAEEIPDVKIKWKLLEDSPHKKTIRQLANAGTHRIYINGQDQFDFSPLTTIKFILSSHETQRQRYLDFIQKIYSPLELRELFDDLQAGDYSALKSQIHKLCNALGDSIEEAIIDKTDPILYMDRWGITIQDARQLLIQFRRTQYNIPKPASYRTDYDAIAMAGQILAGRALPDGRQPVNLRTAVAAAATETNTPSSFDQVETCIVAPNAPLATFFNQDDLIRTMSGDESLKGKDRMRCVQKGKKDGQYYFQDILEDLRYPLDLLISILEGRTQDIGISIQALEQCISKISNVNPCYECALKRAKGPGCVLYDMYDVASYQLIVAARNFELVGVLKELVINIDDLENPGIKFENGIPVKIKFPIQDSDVEKSRDEVLDQLLDRLVPDYNITPLRGREHSQQEISMLYPENDLAIAASWPDMDLLLPPIKAPDYDVVEPTHLLEVEQLNAAINHFKAIAVNSQTELANYSTELGHLEQLIARTPLGNEAFRNDLMNEMRYYYQLITLRYQYRDVIAAYNDGEIIPGRNEEFLDRLRTIYGSHELFDWQDITQIMGLEFESEHLVTRMQSLFGRDSIRKIRRYNIQDYGASDTLMAYEYYLRNNVTLSDLQSALGLTMDLANWISNKYSLNRKKYDYKKLDEDTTKRICNLWLMTDMTIEQIITLLRGLHPISSTTISQTREQMGLRGKPSSEIVTVSKSGETLSIEQAIQASNLSQQGYPLERIKTELGLNTSISAISTTLVRLGLPRKAPGNKIVRSEGSEDVIWIPNGEHRLQVIRSGIEYAMVDHQNNFVHISKVAYQFLRYVTQSGISLGQAIRNRIDDTYLELVPYPLVSTKEAKQRFLNCIIEELATAKGKLTQPEP